MCGLLAMFDRVRPVDEVGAGALLDRLVHRGPDDRGTALRWNGHLFLGHRRLAILDTGPAGHQPMRDAVTGSTLLFNGAIYNFLELRAELAALGHVFVGDSDTEVVLHAWRRWGEAAFARFNGMWAIILHDAPSDTLVVCRDRLGVKPLYHCRHAECCVFGSEVRVVRDAAGVSPRVNDDAVFDLLVAGITDDDGRSFEDGVVEVPPGSLWRLDRDGRLRRSRFHDWPASPDAFADTPPADRESIRALLLDATRIRMRSDVPSALLLSGGLDSSVVAWAVSETSNRTNARTASFSAVTYGYDDAAMTHDETARAQQTARAYGLAVDRLAQDPVPTLDALERMLDAQEQPIATPSVLAGFRIYHHLHARGYKVALTGEGADELFAGYSRLYTPLLVRDGLRRNPGSTMRRIAGVAPGALAARLVWDLPLDATAQLLRRRKPNVAVIADGFWHDMRDRLGMLHAAQRAALGPRMRDEVLRLRLPMLLRYADRSSMAAAIEVRAPFLDHRIVDMAMRMPAAQKVGNGIGKAPLRDAFAPLLPREITSGPKVRGLGMAEQFQLGRIDFRHLLDAPPPDAARYVDVGGLRAALAARPDDPSLWGPIGLLLWLRQRSRPQ